MPQEILRKPQEVKMPAELLTATPEELDAWLTKMAFNAAEKGQEQIKDLSTIEQGLPEASSHKSKIAELKSESIANQSELKKGLAKNGVKIEEAEEPANAWTPEMVANLQSKMAAKKEAKSKEQEAKAAAERRRFLGDLTLSLMPLDEKLTKLAQEIDPKNITSVQQKEVEMTEKIFETYFQQGKITDEEKYQILSQMPNFVEAKKAVLSFQISREEENIKKNERMKKNPSTVTLRGTGTAMHTLQDKRIEVSREKIKDLTKTIEELKKAA